MQRTYLIMKNNAKSILQEGILAILPNALISKNLLIENNHLVINNINLKLDKNVHLVGFGKAVSAMARSVEQILGDHLIRGIISIPKGTVDNFANNAQRSIVGHAEETKIKVMEGATNNLPDEDSYTSAKMIANYVSTLEKDHILLVLISGGGSALLPLPIPPVTIAEKVMVTKTLSACGATIQELNTVRKRLSLIKGGGLLRMARGQVISLIISDIIGDPIDLIASAPTLENNDPPYLGMNIIKKYHLEKDLPESVIFVLGNHQPTTQSLEMGHHFPAHNIIIGNNKILLDACLKKAESLGYQGFILSSEISGESREVGKCLAEMVRCIINIAKMTEDIEWSIIEEFANTFSTTPNAMKEIISLGAKSLKALNKICILVGGETTVHLTGKGVGGRNQEMALAFGIASQHISNNVIFLSSGTDGIDGPTDAAGGLAYPSMVKMALEAGLDPNHFLQNNDSYGFYSRFNGGKDHLLLGHTGTNVMDIQILLVEP